jgi:hypothetical protein
VVQAQEGEQARAAVVTPLPSTRTAPNRVTASCCAFFPTNLERVLPDHDPCALTRPNKLLTLEPQYAMHCTKRLSSSYLPRRST